MSGDATKPTEGTVLDCFSRGFIALPGMSGVCTEGAEVRCDEEDDFELEFWDLGLLRVFVLAEGDDGSSGRRETSGTWRSRR
jgi:hypothetical protein